MAMMSDLSLQESCMAALRHMGVEVRALVGKTNELEAENVKLRNLIELMRSCPRDKGECDECRSLNDGCEVERLSRDYGIEVDE